MKMALVALLSLALLPAHLLAQTSPAKRPARRAAPQTAAVVVITVTNGVGEPIEGVNVTATGPLDRGGTTDNAGTLRIQGMRVGTYRLRFDADGYLSFEKELVTRAGTKTIDVPVTLTEAPPPPPPPEPPAPREPEVTLPPPGTAKALELPDWIEKNFISSREPHKESVIGCSGVGQALVWQVREPWTGRQHDGADGLFYVVGGEGTLRIDEKEVAVSAGSFAVVPRGTTYSLTRQGRNPLILLAVLAGAPCSAE